jgi:hypothetical protein
MEERSGYYFFIMVKIFLKKIWRDSFLILPYPPPHVTIPNPCQDPFHLPNVAKYDLSLTGVKMARNS